MQQSAQFQNFMKTLGPGIMFAGTCIGGSHLVQSTRAGAYYGFGMLFIVILANILKYPFFEFASRYTSATGKSILEGYKERGRWILVLYALVTLSSMCVITAAIGAFTGGLANNLFTSFLGENIASIKGHWWVLMVFIVTLGILAYGRFGLLDKILKGVGLILVITTLIAFISVLIRRPAPTGYPGVLEILQQPEDVLFAIALMGWMPIAIDMSAWHSLWTQQRIKQTNYYPTLKETLLDFNIGYGITFVLAILFLTIGAYILYASPTVTRVDLENMGGLAYAQTLVNMFTAVVGDWSYYIISLAAFTTMFGTCITLVDGYSRSVERTMTLLTSTKENVTFSRKRYIIWVVVTLLGGYLFILFFVNKLGDIMDLATTVSFIIAPLAGILNFAIIFNKEVRKACRPPRWLVGLAIAGIAFLLYFTWIYIKLEII